jgi:hypothetical protein
MTVPTPVVWIADDLGRVECQVMSAAIVHGRDDPTSQPVASTATLEVVGPLPSTAVIGARVGLEAELDGIRYARFSGEITDLGVGWDSVDIARPRIIAAGDLARLGRRPVGDVPWPQELDGARVSRILTLAGFPPDPLLSDPGTVAVLPRDVDRQPALALAQSTASDGAGMVWQDREGRIRYADGLHRRGAPTTIELRACDIGIGVGWSASLEGLFNEAHIRYGTAPTGGGDQPEVVASDQASIDARGLFGASLTTQLATAVDAQKRADLTVGRQADPAWILDGLELDLSILDHARTVKLLEAVEVHELVSVTGLPTSSPIPSAFLWVEGWRESIVGVDGGVSWVISFATSDYCRTGAPPAWDDLPSSVSWDTLDPARTWDRATCIPPQPSQGRWHDVPASLRWDTLDPAVTWDTWPY